MPNREETRKVRKLAGVLIIVVISIIIICATMYCYNSLINIT